MVVDGGFVGSSLEGNWEEAVTLLVVLSTDVSDSVVGYREEV
jgi:hypothetical protein